MTTIPFGDEAALSWFFGPAQTMFARSTFGAMLERAAENRSGSCDCRKCGGAGILETDDQLAGVTVLDESKPGKRRSAIAGDWCPRCNGTGTVAAPHLKLAICPVCDNKRANHRSSCRTCCGTGRLPLTVLITAEGKSYSGSAPDDTQLARLGVVSRRLARMDYQSLEVLRRYYGDTGARWGRTSKGRVFSIYPLTSAGQRLLKRTRRDGDDQVTLTDCERLGVQADLQKSQPKQDRGALLVQADEQARALLEAAAEEWEEAKGKKRNDEPEAA